jgi:hypothetical protein
MITRSPKQAGTLNVSKNPLCVRNDAFSFCTASQGSRKTVQCCLENLRVRTISLLNSFRWLHWLLSSKRAKNLCGLSVTLSVPACLQPVSVCQRSSLNRGGLSNTSSKQVQRRPNQIKACQVVRHESLWRPLSNPLTEKCNPSSSS